MYVPPQFKEERPEILAAAIRAIKLATIVTLTDEGYHATHAPMVLSGSPGRFVLESHFARANPHWRALDGPVRSLAIFQGPRAYISPSYYASKREHGKVVPTWNYVAVHAHGTLRSVEDADFLMRHIDELTRANEATRAAPWAVSDAPDRFIEATARGIVGVRFEVERLEGSWKMAQHKPEADRRGAIAGLAASSDPAEREVGALMATIEASREAG